MSKKQRKLKPIVVIKPHEEVVIALPVDESVPVDEPIFNKTDPEPIFTREEEIRSGFDDAKQTKADSVAADILATRAATESKDKSDSFSSSTIVLLALIIVIGIAVFSLFEKDGDIETKLIAAQTDIIQLRASIDQTSKGADSGQYKQIKSDLEQAQLDIAQLSAELKESAKLKSEPAQSATESKEVEKLKAEQEKMREQGIAAVTKIEKQLYRINRYFGWVE